jgi:regulator of protease activity HflC (stomatin/prohibitin superfamily)
MALNQIGNTFSRAAAAGVPGWLKTIFVIVGVIIALLVFTPIAIVPTGYRGIMLTFSSAQTAPLTEGIHFRIPLVQSVYKMPVMIERSETESEAASSDLQRVHTTVVLNYHIDPGQVVNVYRNLGPIENLEPNIIDPAVQEAMKAITARYTAEQLVTKRPTVADAIHGLLTTRLQRHGILIDEFSVTNFKFSASFDQAIEDKTVAEQRRLKAEIDLRTAKIEADQGIARANGIAESTKLNAEAQAVSLKVQRDAVSPELIELRKVEAQLKAIEKWDGKLPSVNSGVTPFIQVQPEAR